MSDTTKQTTGAVDLVQFDGFTPGPWLDDDGIIRRDTLLGCERTVVGIIHGGDSGREKAENRLLVKSAPEILAYARELETENAALHAENAELRKGYDAACADAVETLRIVGQLRIDFAGYESEVKRLRDALARIATIMPVETMRLIHKIAIATLRNPLPDAAKPDWDADTILEREA